MFGIGSAELIIILAIVALLFGPSRLPEIGKKLGEAMREFTRAKDQLIKNISEPDEREDDASDIVHRNR